MQNTQHLETLLAALQPELRHRGGGLHGYLKPDEIEDAVQDACVQVLEMIRKDKVHTNLSALVHLIVKRRACRQLTHQQSQKRLMEGYAQHLTTQDRQTPNPLTSASQSEEALLLWDAICKLDDLERLTVGLRYFGDYSYQAIVDELGFDDQEAVNNCLRRARRQLRHHLRDTDL